MQDWEQHDVEDFCECVMLGVESKFKPPTTWQDRQAVERELYGVAEAFSSVRAQLKRNTRRANASLIERTVAKMEDTGLPERLQQDVAQSPLAA